MRIEVNGHIIDKWANLNVSLIYESVVSTFSFDVYFDPFNKVHREIFLPGAYNTCTITSDNDEVLVTGILFSPSFKAGSQKYLTNISGCSTGSVLRDCNYLMDANGVVIFNNTYQVNGKSLAAIAQTICDGFGLTLIIDEAATDEAAKVYKDDINVSSSGSILSFLSDLANYRNLILSHTNFGYVKITQASDSSPIFNFEGASPDYEINLSFDGQQMHSNITCLQDAGTPSSSISNPYVQPSVNSGTNILTPNLTSIYENANTSSLRRQQYKAYNAAYRPSAFIKDTSDGDTVPEALSNALAKELAAIEISIDLKGWTLNGNIVRPNTYITIKEPELYLFNRTKFFISQVDFTGDAETETCVITCTVPEVYNGEYPVNIFTANGNNTNYQDAPTNSGMPDQIIFSKFPITKPGLDL